MITQINDIKNKKIRKISSSFSLTNCLKHLCINGYKYINLSVFNKLEKAVDQPRFEPGIFVFQTKVLTAKLLAHNNTFNTRYYLNL